MIDRVLMPLGDLIDGWGLEKVEKLLSTFKCRESDLEDFLINNAISFHEKHRSRTYLLMSDDQTKVLAYVTLSIKCMKIPEDNQLSNRIKKDMDVYRDMFQSYLIGQLGKADGVEKGIGAELIRFALTVFKQSFVSVGCRTVRLDCKKDLIKFYEKNGFFLISQKDDGNDLYHMVMLF